MREEREGGRRYADLEVNGAGEKKTREKKSKITGVQKEECGEDRWEEGKEERKEGKKVEMKVNKNILRDGKEELEKERRDREKERLDGRKQVKSQVERQVRKMKEIEAETINQ